MRIYSKEWLYHSDKVVFKNNGIEFVTRSGHDVILSFEELDRIEDEEPED